MKRWAFAALGLYLLILVVLTVTVTEVVMPDKASSGWIWWAGPGSSVVIWAVWEVLFLYVDRWRRRHPALAGRTQ